MRAFIGYGRISIKNWEDSQRFYSSWSKLSSITYLSAKIEQFIPAGVPYGVYMQASGSISEVGAFFDSGPL